MDGLSEQFWSQLNYVCMLRENFKMSQLVVLRESRDAAQLELAALEPLEQAARRCCCA